MSKQTEIEQIFAAAVLNASGTAKIANHASVPESSLRSSGQRIG